MRNLYAAQNARFSFFLDSLGKIARFPVRLLLWFVKGCYLAICMISWGLILWVLGEKHVGILKMLILLAGGSIWILLLLSLYSLWH